jgi:hypothetical protein
MKMSDQSYPVIDDADAADAAPAKIEDFASKSPEEIALINAKADRKRIVAALDSGALCCQPDEKGFADTTPARNLVNDSLYHGMYQLLLKNHQKQNGFPTAEYGTFAQFDKAARFAGKTGTIKKGEHGFTITLNVDGELKPIRLFNLAQAVHPGAVREYASHVFQEKQKYLKQAKGDNYREPKPETKGEPIVCSTTRPEEYLGQYFAALSLGRDFKVTPGQNAHFTENMKNAVFAHGPEGHINPYNVSVICNGAGKYCKSFIPEYLRYEAAQAQAAPGQEKPAPQPKRSRETESMGR